MNKEESESVLDNAIEHSKVDSYTSDNKGKDI